MRRSALSFLQNWKRKSGRKPLIIRGARQVGKTWLMKEFAKTEYENFAYVDFEDNQQLKHCSSTILTYHVFCLLSRLQQE